MFLEINDANFKDSVAGGLSIVLFYKEKCPFCKAMEKIITKFAERPTTGKDIKYFHINRETSPQFAEELEIARTPAVLVFRDGRKIHAKSGDVTYRDLERMIA